MLARGSGMTGPAAKVVSPSAAEVRAALDRMLGSETFASAQRLQRFLGYVVEQTLLGNEATIKGYAVGVEVFGRPADFDPTVDAIVRVEAGRLRGKLREYYDTHGAEETFRIELPKGAYVPRFVPIERTAFSVAPAAMETRKTLLVLPFKNLSGDAGEDYFADGLSEDLIAALSRIQDLTLIARHSSFHYKQLDAAPQQIAKETGADYLMNGSVRRSADRIRVFVQMVSMATQALVWSERYDRDLKEVFALQDEVVAAIVQALEVKLVPSTDPAPPMDIEAYDLVSRGRECFWTYRPADVDESRQLFKRAIERAPDYAFAHAWYARALTLPFAFHWHHDPAPLDEALYHAQMAAGIAPHLPIGFAMIAWIQIWRGAVEDALAAGQRAVDLDDGDIDARMWYAFALVAAGRGEDALRPIERARRRNPHTPATSIEGLAHWLEHRLDAAVASFSRGITRTPEYVAFYVHKAAACAELGQRAPAVAAMAELKRRHPTMLEDMAAWAIFADSALRDRLNQYRMLAYQWFIEDSH